MPEPTKARPAASRRRISPTPTHHMSIMTHTLPRLAMAWYTEDHDLLTLARCCSSNLRSSQSLSAALLPGDRVDLLVCPVARRTLSSTQGCARTSSQCEREGHIYVRKRHKLSALGGPGLHAGHDRPPLFYCIYMTEDCDVNSQSKCLQLAECETMKHQMGPIT